MTTLKKTLCALGLVTLLSPAASWGETHTWERGEDLLDQHLQPGQKISAYRNILGDLGFTITSVNYYTPDYVEYEAVKDDESYEVQIDIDENTGRATNLDIARNLWQTNATETALEQPEQMVSLHDPSYILVVTPVLVESGRDRSGMEKVVRDLEALPVGRNEQFYRNTLQERGYQVLDSMTAGNRLQLRAEKNGQEALLTIQFDPDTGKSTYVSAFPLLINVPQGHGEQRRMVRQSLDESRKTREASEKNEGREMSGTRKILRELEALPVGQDKKFYRQALRQRGFEITDTTINENQTRIEAEKNGQRIALDIQFDAQTGKSNQVEARMLHGQADGSQLSQAQRQQDQWAEME
jgi:hypothetical protein